MRRTSVGSGKASCIPGKAEGPESEPEPEALSPCHRSGRMLIMILQQLITMGRQANPVVGKHFTRGNKIDDASNRYQWNCKQCGEHFPKGRIDTLYNHLTAQCPALSLQEKTSVTLQIHELNLAANAANSVKKKARSENANKASATSPAPDERDFSALNVLAEASHQVVATQYGYPPSFTTGDDPGSQSMVLDPALEDGTFSGTSFCGVVAARPSGENGELLYRLLASSRTDVFQYFHHLVPLVLVYLWLTTHFFIQLTHR